MRSESCIFCRIANGEIPSRTVYEDEEFRVILDMGPATKGHALVLPKEHYADLFELPEDLAMKAMLVGKRTAKRICSALGADGLNLVQNNKAVAGQTVPHFHLHIIPRYQEDGQKIGWNPKDPGAEALDAVLGEILKEGRES